MGDIVTLKRRSSGTPPAAAPDSPFAPAATMFAAGVTVACWWTTAWLTALRFSVASAAEKQTVRPPVIRSPLLRLHVNNARLRNDASASPQRGRSM